MPLFFGDVSFLTVVNNAGNLDVYICFYSQMFSPVVTNYELNDAHLGNYCDLSLFLAIDNIINIDALIIIIIMVIFKCYFSGELIALS